MTSLAASTDVERALDHVAEGRTPDVAEATALLDTPAERMADLLADAEQADRSALGRFVAAGHDRDPS